MQGTLADLDLASLAVVTSLGRTSLRLEVTDPSGLLVGNLVLKAGRVVSATGGGVRGRNALSLIMSSGGNSLFRLVREPLDYDLSSALALVEELTDLGRPQLAQASSEQLTMVDLPPIRMSGAPSARVRMMQGRLDEFELPTVLQAIGMGRSCVELDVRNEARALIGTVRVKAGQVVSAQARNVEGLAAFAALMRDPDCHDFVAFRIDADLASVAAIGTVTQLVLAASDVPVAPIAAPRPVAPAAAPAAAPPAPAVAPIAREPVLVMEGSLADVDIRTLLEALAVTRQFSHLHILGRDQAPLGELQLKSGMIVAARAGSREGAEALVFLLGASSDCRFRMLAGAFDLRAVPVGSIRELLAVATATTAQRRSQRASQLLRIAIPISFLLGGAVVFLIVRAPRTTAPVSAPHDPVVMMNVQPAAPAPSPALAPASEPPPAAAPAAPEPPAAAAPPASEPPPAAVPPVAAAAHEAPAAGEPATPVHAVTPSPRLPRKISVSAAQAALKQLGFDPGPIDNVNGVRTRRAVRRFQGKVSLPQTGLIDDATWGALDAQLTGN